MDTAPQFLKRGCTPGFYPNVTMLRSGLCYRKSVCGLSVYLVRRTQGAEILGSISSPFVP